MGEKNAEERYDEACALIEEGEFAKAAEIGHSLIRGGESPGYEILALAAEAQDDLPHALEFLRSGVSRHPHAWRCWQLLGTFLSLSEMPKEALAAYAKARECPDAWTASLDLNEAVTLDRLGDQEGALTRLSLIKDEELFLKAQATRLDILNRLGRHGEVLKTIETSLARHWPGDVGNELSHVWVEKGIASWKANIGNDIAVECAWKAIGYDKLNNRALWLIRQVAGEFSQAPKEFVITVEGEWDELIDGVPHTYETTYEVVADTRSEALSMIEPLEPETLRSSLRITNVEVLELEEQTLKGVYGTSAYELFPGS